MDLEFDPSLLYASTILPECILIFSLIIILILDLILEIKNKSLLFYISLLSLSLSIIILFFQLQKESTISFSGNFHNLPSWRTHKVFT